MKVENMTSTNGNKIANQFVIYGDNNELTFQSYDSTIVRVDPNNKTITFGCDWNYSRTTSKYRNMFFEDYAHLFNHLNNKQAVEAAIEEGCTLSRLGTKWEVKYIDKENF